MVATKRTYEIDPNTAGNIVISITNCPFGNKSKKGIVKIGSLSCMICPDFEKSNLKKHVVLCKSK